MPYDKISELLEQVQKALPKHDIEIYRAAYKTMPGMNIKNRLTRKMMTKGDKLPIR